MSYYSLAQSFFDDEHWEDYVPPEPRIEDYIYSAEPCPVFSADSTNDEQPLSAAAPTAEGSSAVSVSTAASPDAAAEETETSAPKEEPPAEAAVPAEEPPEPEPPDNANACTPNDAESPLLTNLTTSAPSASSLRAQPGPSASSLRAQPGPASPEGEEPAAEAAVPAEEPTEPEAPDNANACTSNDDKTPLLTNLTTSAPSANSLAAQPPDGFPPFSTAVRCLTRKAKPPEELIEGILRRGHKMLVSGPSKAGKSFLLMELCIAIAEGREWLGFRCRRGRVLYINLEIDSESCFQRFENIYAAMGITPEYADYITVWNLRGYAQPLNELVPVILERMQHTIGMPYNAIIIDPIYKVITGDENSATDMGTFCNQFDLLCDATGASVIYCHHHSKGMQGGKRSIDRASGSGVFARDPDAVLDIIRLELSEQQKSELPPGTTAWRMESNLREFRNITPLNMTFQWPLHLVDYSRELQNAPAEGSFQSFQLRAGKATREEWREKFMRAYAELAEDGIVTVKAMAAKLDVSDNTVREHMKDCEGLLFLHRGILLACDADAEKKSI